MKNKRDQQKHSLSVNKAAKKNSKVLLWLAINETIGEKESFLFFDGGRSFGILFLYIYKLLMVKN
jgi:hypothetical protein